MARSFELLGFPGVFCYLFLVDAAVVAVVFSVLRAPVVQFLLSPGGASLACSTQLSSHSQEGLRAPCGTKGQGVDIGSNDSNV